MHVLVFRLQAVFSLARLTPFLECGLRGRSAGSLSEQLLIIALMSPEPMSSEKRSSSLVSELSTLYRWH